MERAWPSRGRTPGPVGSRRRCRHAPDPSSARPPPRRRNRCSPNRIRWCGRRSRSSPGSRSAWCSVCRGWRTTSRRRRPRSRSRGRIRLRARWIRGWSATGWSGRSPDRWARRRRWAPWSSRPAGSAARPTRPSSPTPRRRPAPPSPGGRWRECAHGLEAARRGVHGHRLQHRHHPDPLLGDGRAEGVGVEDLLLDRVHHRRDVVDPVGRQQPAGVLLEQGDLVGGGMVNGSTR